MEREREDQTYYYSYLFLLRAEFRLTNVQEYQVVYSTISFTSRMVDRSRVPYVQGLLPVSGIPFTVRTGGTCGAPYLDGEVDEVGVDEDVVRGSESRVVREEHGRGHLLHVVRLRLFRLGGVDRTTPIAPPHTDEPAGRDEPAQRKGPSGRSEPPDKREVLGGDRCKVASLAVRQHGTLQ